MSQYPPPYSSPYAYPPGYGGDPYSPARGAARRAGILLIVLGALTMCFGGCMGLALRLPEHLLHQQLEAMPSSPGQPLTVEAVKRQFLISMIVLVAAGLPMIVLGVFVRRGSKGAIITSMVLTIIAILWLALSTVGTLFMAMQSPMLVIGACVPLVPLALFILLLVWLIQGLRGSPQALPQMQYQQQYWQYQQQQQPQYGQPGYGFPPQPPPQPPSQPDQSRGASDEPPAPGTS